MVTDELETKPSASQPTPRNKLIIRRLPPTLPEETFWQSVATWIKPETCLWKRFVKGKASEGHDSRPIYSRAYVLMATPEALIAFHRGFDGHVFRSKTGIGYQAVVEFSPVQKTPYKPKTEIDARQGTIDEDPDHISFLESLTAPATKPVLETSIPPPQPTSTPLLDHLRATASTKSSSKGKKNKGGGSINTGGGGANPKEAALASVNKAASRRAPYETPSMTMIAGKGRGVTITPTGSGDLQAADHSEGKKPKNRKKGKPQGSNLAGESSTLDNGKQKPTPNIPTNRAESPGGSEARGRGGGRGGGGIGGGRGRGRGDASVKTRSAHGTVMEILTRNAEGDAMRGRGGSRGSGRGRGGGPSINPIASQARIDM